MNIGNLEVYGVIYKITNKINNKVYIGQTTKKRGFLDRYPNKGHGIERVYRHYKTSKNCGYGYNIHLFNAIKKYGFNSFEVVEIFDVAFSKDELDIKEIVWIRHYNSFNNGYNSTLGGGGKKGSFCLTGKDNPLSRKVCQISLDGKLLKIWACISDVEKELKIDSSKICCVCRGQRKTTQGYVWVYYEDYDENINYARKPRARVRTKGLKEVVLLNENMELVNTYKSVNEASRNLGISTFEVSNICSKRKRKSNLNLLYKNDYINI